MGKVVDVDENLYKSISSDISSLTTALEGAKSNLAPCFSGELQSFYNGSCNNDIDRELLSVIDEIDNLSLNIDASVNAYQRTDEDLALGLNSLIDEIFSEENEEEFVPYDGDYSSSTNRTQSLEERRKYLENLIDSYEQVLQELTSEFKSKYDEANGYHYVNGFDPKTYALLETLMVSFINGGSYEGDGGAFNHSTGTGSYTINQLQRFTEFAKENNLFEKMDDYFSGKSWQESKMSDFNDIIIHNLTGYDNYKLEHEGDSVIFEHLDECVEASFEDVDFKERTNDEKVELIQKILNETDLSSYELYHLLRKLGQDIVKTQLPDGSYRIEIKLYDSNDGTTRTIIVEHGKMTEG